MLNSDWKDKTWSYDWLAKVATSKRTKIGNWLQDIGVVPSNVKWKRSPMSIYNGLDRGAIKAVVLAELAHEYDKTTEEFGDTELTTESEFVEWLAYEIKGHPKREQFMAVMSTLGKRGPHATD